MSVLKMIVVDDQHYVSGELHGSQAHKVYAACAQTPKNLNELDEVLKRLLPGENLRSFFGFTEWLDLEPVDAGLIVVDLAKKWIYAEDSYFGAHRTGTCHPNGYDGDVIEYAFPEEWQFVAEVKWFRYLYNCDLKPYWQPDNPYGAIANAEDDFETDEEMELEEEDEWDEGLASIHVEYANRICSLVDLKPENESEESDLYTLEHIVHYDQKAETAQYRIKQAHKTITRLNIELQAVENLWQRTHEPRWEQKLKTYQAQIEVHKKRIDQLSEECSEATAMAAELRTLVTTEKFQKVEWLRCGKDLK
jgi:hypothetical protein